MGKSAFLFLTIAALLLASVPAVRADWRQEAEAQLQARQYQKALEILGAQTAEAGNVDFLCLRAQAYLETGRLIDAVKDMEKALAVDPNCAECHGIYARSFTRQRDMDNAMREGLKAVELGKTPTTLLARATAYMGAGDLDKALADLDEAIRLKSDQAECYLARGAIHRFREQYDKAMADFQTAAKYDKRPYKSHLEFATTHALRGDPIAAKTEINKAVELAPEIYLGYLARAFIHQEYGENDLALADFNKAAALAPQTAEVIFAKANMEVMLGRNTQAEQTLKGARAVCDGIPDWYVMLYLVLKSLNKNEESLALLDDLVSKTPHQWNGYNLRGQHYAANRDFEKALIDFDKAISIAPKAVEPKMNKATVLAALKRPQEALAMLNTLIAEHPKNITILEMRMQLHEALGNSAAALADLQAIEALKQTKK